MTKLVNRAKMTTATTGTGTLTLGSAVDGYQTFADAGVANADVVRYVIEDGDAWEIGLGTYTASGTTLTRGSIESSNADAALNLTGNAVVYVSAAAADLQELVDFADNFVLPTADGTTGQVLTTNGSGVLTFTTISAGATSINGLSDARTVAANSLSLGTTVNAEHSVFLVGGNASSTRSVYIGDLAGDSSTGNQNVAIGSTAGRRMTGRRNIAIGWDTMGFTSTDRSGEGNIVVGADSRTGLTTGKFNTALGYSVAGGLTTGQNNVFVGRSSGGITTGSNNSLIGHQAAPSSATVSNEITLGNSSIATLRCQVTTITSLSDARDKTDIQPLNAGLEFVEALNPVSFTWNMRDGGKVGAPDTGFIAQDLQAAQADTGVTIPGLVFDANPEKLEAGYGKLTPVLVQAIKDLSAKVNELEARLEDK